MNSSVHFRFFGNNWTEKQRASPKSVKLRYSEKATNIEKNSHFVLTALNNFKRRWEIFSNCLAFSQYLNFIYSNFCKNK